MRRENTTPIRISLLLAMLLLLFAAAPSFASPDNSSSAFISTEYGNTTSIAPQGLPGGEIWAMAGPNYTAQNITPQNIINGLTSIVVCDDCTAPLNLPWPVYIYGVPYTSVNVSANGGFIFGPPGSTHPWSSGSRAVSFCTEDLYPLGGTYGGVYYDTTTYSDRVILQFRNVTTYGSRGSPDSQRRSGEIILYRDGKIEIINERYVGSTSCQQGVRENSSFPTTYTQVTYPSVSDWRFTQAGLFQLTPILNSTFGTNYTSENLTVYNQSSTGATKNIISWQRNGIPISILNMPFEGGSNATGTRDFSGFGKNGTVGGATWGATSGYDGKGAYVFDGINDYVRGNTGAITFTNFTYSAWVKASGSTFTGYQTFIDLDNDVQFFGRLDNNYVIYGRCGTVPFGNITAGAWAHLAWSVNGSTYRVYVNGAETGNGTGCSASVSGSAIGIGSDSAGGSEYFNGTIDDVMILNRSLSAQEVRAIYQNRTNLMASQDLAAGETWRACVTPTNASMNGSAECSNYVTIRSIPPTQGVPALNSTLGTNTTSENLTVYNRSTYDAEGGRVTNIVNWLRNSTSIMVLNMPFEGGSNSSFTKDYTPFGNNGTVTGATWGGSAGHDGWGAYSFDGIDDYISLGAPASTNIYGSPSLTIEAWIKRAAPASTGYIVNKGASGGYTLGIGVSPCTGTTDIRASKYGVVEICISGVPTNIGWHHIVEVGNDSGVFLFVDGTRVNGSTNNQSWGSSSNNVIIGAYSAGSSTFNGTIGGVRIYNRSLSGEEILALYRNRTDLIVSQELRGGDPWRACITPNDGFVDGTTNCSNTVTLLSAAPNLTATAISPSPAYKTTPLVANTTYTHSSGNPGNVTFRWYVNGINVLNQSFAGTASGTTVTSVLPNTWFNRSSYVNVSISAFDGSQYSATLWSPTIQVQNARPVFQGNLDLNNDGYLDILISTWSSSSPIYWGNATGFNASTKTDLPSNSAVGNAIADLNGDGYLDIVFPTFNGVNSTIYWGNISGFNASRTTGLPCRESYGASIADLNNDGYLDVVITTYTSNSTIYWGNATGFNPSRNSTLPAPSGFSSSIADLNNDGYLDIAFSTFGSTSPIYWGNASGFNASVSTSLAYSGGSGGNTPADLNNDGYLDMVFSTYTSANSPIYWGNASGFNASLLTGMPTLNSYGNSVADLNNDGWPDIVFSNFNNGTTNYINSTIYWGNASGFNASRNTTLPTIGSYVNSVADLNNDGWPDIVFSNYYNGTTFDLNSTIYWGNATGFNASRKTLLPTSSGLGVSIAVGPIGTANTYGSTVGATLVPDFRTPKNRNLTSFFDLDVFFRDYDGDSMNISVLGNNSNATVLINGTTHRLSIIPAANWSGRITNVRFIATDGSGNATSNNFSIIVLNSLPGVAPNSPAGGAYLANSTVNFNWTASDADDPALSCNLTIDGAVSASGISSTSGVPRNYSVAGLAQGLHRWNVTCWDSSNIIAYGATRNFTVDTSIPSINFTFPTPANGSILAQNHLAANVTANDTSTAIANLTIRLYNATALFRNGTASPLLANVSYYNNFTGLPDGTYYLNATATDMAGNLNATETRTIVLDATRPYVNTSALRNATGGTAALQDFPLNLSATVFEATSGLNNTVVWVTYPTGINSTQEYMNCTASNPYRCEFNWTRTTNIGVYRAYFRATDNANLSSLATDPGYNLTFNVTCNNLADGICPGAVLCPLDPDCSSCSGITLTENAENMTINNCKIIVKIAKTKRLLSGVTYDQGDGGFATKNATAYVGDLVDYYTFFLGADQVFLERAAAMYNTVKNVTSPWGGSLAVLQNDSTAIAIRATYEDSSVRLQKDIKVQNGSEIVKFKYTIENIGNATVSNVLLRAYKDFDMGTAPSQETRDKKETYEYSTQKKIEQVNQEARLNSSRDSKYASTYYTVQSDQTGTKNAGIYTVGTFAYVDVAQVKGGDSQVLPNNTILDGEQVTQSDIVEIYSYMCGNLSPGAKCVVSDGAGFSNDPAVIGKQMDDFTNDSAVLLADAAARIGNASVASMGQNTPFNITVDVLNQGMVNRSGLLLASYVFDSNNTQKANLNSSGVSVPALSTLNDRLVGQSSTGSWAFGTYKLEVRLFDSGTLKDTSTYFFNVTDTAQPSVSLSLPAEGYNSSSANISFTFTATDNSPYPLNCSLWLDGALNMTNSSVQNGTPSSFSATAIGEGRHNWSVRCRDSAGNIGTSETRNFSVDTVPPSILLTYPANRTTFNTSAMAFNYTATDALSSTMRCSLYFDGTLNQTNISVQNGTPSSFAVPYVPDATHYWAVQCRDRMNNTNTSETRNFTVDTTPPSITWISTVPPSPVLNNGTARQLAVNFTSSEYPINITFRLYNSSGAAVATSGPHQLNSSSDLPYPYGIPAGLAEGTYFLNMTAKDAAGNNKTVAIATINVDRTAPSVSLTSPPPGYVTNVQGQNLTFIASDAASPVLNCSLYINGALNQTNESVQESTASRFGVNFADGVYTWYVACTDLAGNLNSSASRGITVDTVPSTIALDKPAPGYASNSSNVTFNFTVSEGFSGALSCSLLIDGALNSTNSSVQNNTPTRFAVTMIEDGWHTWSVRCTDAANNTNSSVERDFAVVTIPAGVFQQAPPERMLTNSTSVQFNFTARSGTSPTMNCSLYLDLAFSQMNESVLNNTRTSMNATLASGNHTWYVRCLDIASNANVSATRNFTVDPFPPAIALNYPVPNMLTNSSQVPFNFTATDNIAQNMSCSVILDASVAGTNASSYNNTPTLLALPVADGPHTWSARCYDGVNTNTSQQQNLTVDTGAPRITSVSTMPPSPILTNASAFNISVNFTSSEYPINVTLYLYNSSGSPVNSSGPVQLNSSADLPANYPFPAGLPEGNYSLNMTARDAAGNTNFTGVANITIDTTPPAISGLTTVPASPILNNGQAQNVLVNFSSSEYPVGVTFYLYNSSGALDNVSILVMVNSSPEFPIRYTLPAGLTTGNYTLNMSARDTAGNTAIVPAANVTVDTTPPYPSNITTVPATPIFNNGAAQNVAVNFTSSEYPVNATFRLYDSDGVLVDVQGPYVLNSPADLPRIYGIPALLDEGTYRLNLTLSDRSGNSNTTNIANITVDRTAPVIYNVATVPPSPILTNASSRNITVNFTSSEYPINVTFYLYNASGALINYSVTFPLNSSAGLPLNFTLPPGLPQGTYTLRVNGTDMANNSGTAQAATITIDTQPPSVSGLYTVPPSMIYNNGTQQGVQVYFNSTEYPMVISFYLYNASGTLENSSGPFTLNNQFELPLTYYIPAGLAQGGIYTLNMTFADQLGNANFTGVANITVDRTTPSITGVTTVPPQPLSTNGSALNLSVNFTSSEYPINITFYLYDALGSVVNSMGPTRINSSSELPIVYPIPGGLPTGNYTINMSAQDNAGNINTTRIGNLTIDATPPSITDLATVPPSPVLTNGSALNLSVNFTSSEYPINITFYLYDALGSAVNTMGPTRVNSSSELPIIYPIPGGLPTGNYTINMSARDPAGNLNVTNVANLSVDATAPSITGVSTAPPTPVYANGTALNLSVNFSSSEYPVNATFYLFGPSGAIADTYGPAQLNSSSDLPLGYPLPAGLPDGWYRLNMTLLDPFGNSNSTAIANISVDATAPSIFLNYPPNISGFNTSTVTFNYTPSDGMSSTLDCTLFLDGTDSGSAAAPNGTISGFSLSVANGNHYWWVKCTDGTGNYNSSETRNFSVDATAPSISIAAPADGYLGNDTQLLFNFTPSDDLQPLVNCSIIIDNSTAWSNATAASGIPSEALLPTASGNHSWLVRCSDGANTNSTPPMGYFIDNSAPSIALVSPPEGYMGNSTPPFVFTPTEDLVSTLSCSVMIDGLVAATNASVQSNVQATMFAFAFSGNHSWHITCSDGVNSNSSASRSLVLDTLEPDVSLNSPLDGYVGNDTRLVFSFNVTEDVQPAVNCSLLLEGQPFATNGSVPSNTTSQFNVSVPSGNHTWAVRCTDGPNIGVSPSWTFLSDQSAPQISMNAPFDGFSVISSDPYNTTFNFTVSDDYSPASNCSFYLDTLANYTDEALPNGSVVELYIMLEPGAHTWSVVCTDFVNNTAFSPNRLASITPPAPPSSGGSSPPSRTLAIGASAVCPADLADISVSSSGSGVAAAAVRVLLTTPYEGLVAQGYTDGSGHVRFLMPKGGTYTIYASAGGYGDATPYAFRFTPCTPANATPPTTPPITPPTTPGQNVTEPSNVTQPANGTQPPVPPVTPPTTPQPEQEARQAVKDARDAIASAQAAGKDVSGSLAKLEEAQKAYDAGDYKKAKDLAEEARQLANTAGAYQRPPAQPAPGGWLGGMLQLLQKPADLLPVCLVALVLGAIAAFVILKRGKKAKKEQKPES